MPGLGDLVGVLASSYILGQAARLGVGRGVLLRMAFNVAVEGIVGLIPFAGDVFDAAWKANQRNVRLLEQWHAEPRRARRSSWLLLAGIVLLLGSLVAFSLIVMAIALRWLAHCC